MFFKNSAQKKESEQKNAFITMLSDAYLQSALKEIDDEVVRNAVKGKFASLKYTLSGFDSSGLSYKEKLKLIDLLYDLDIQNSGPIESKKRLERIGLQIKERLGVEAAFLSGIDDLPEGIFDLHRIKGLSREDLEQKVERLLFELEKSHSIADKSVAENISELVAERDILETILYNTSDGVFALDRNGKIITFNNSMETLTGYSLSEVENKSADEYIRFFDDKIPLDTSEYCSMPGTAPNRKAFSKEKITIVKRNGEKRYAKMTSATISEGRSINIGCVVTLKDITKDIELETMKLDFVSIAAHELRTPLTAMRGYLSLLKDEIKKDLDEEHAAYLDKVAISTDQLYVLVENLLNISRIERGNLELNKQEQNWEEVIKEVVEQFKPNAESAKLSLTHVKAKGAIPKVKVDKTMINEVFANLLDNSIRYTPEGGRISIFAEVVGDTVVTHIKDTGVGIPQASIPHIFKKFYRVSTVLKEGKKGTGLGLFISKEIVKLHDGEIWVESDFGNGSTFSFSVPLKEKKEVSVR